MKTLACKAAYGNGDIGAHFAQLVEEARALGVLQTYITTGIHPDDELVGTEIRQTVADWLTAYPLRNANSLQHFISDDWFDRTVSFKLTNRTDTCAAFGGQFYNAALRARKLGFETLELHSATAHIEHAAERFCEAHTRWQIEKPWLGSRMVNKQLKEYQLADRIHVNSEYTRQTFLDRGVNETILVRTHVQANPRFVPLDDQRADETFRAVYVGSISVVTGIPLLLEAFSKLDVADSELLLVGECSSNGMRKYIEGWKAKEPRLRIVTGDPLQFYQQADCYVHPSYHDGYGYAPAEALMCGVPVIVSEDTGAKENVSEGENGYIVPTGSWDAILDRLTYIYNDR